MAHLTPLAPVLDSPRDIFQQAGQPFRLVQQQPAVVRHLATVEAHPLLRHVRWQKACKHLYSTKPAGNMRREKCVRVHRIEIFHFRGIKFAKILLPRHAVLVGDNNVGKTTVLEALDLALGPDRLNRQPPINEHDFYGSDYSLETVSDADKEAGEGKRDQDVRMVDGLVLPEDGEISEKEEIKHAPFIKIEVMIADLSEEQKGDFGGHIEFWDSDTDTFYIEDDPERIDSDDIEEVLRVTFYGRYNPDEDDFEGSTYFTASLPEDVDLSVLMGRSRSAQGTLFTKQDKRVCGFLYLRSLRTGTRALSLEHGSLLDIILRLEKVRPQMWESTLKALSKFSFSAELEESILDVLKNIEEAMEKYVPKEWGVDPRLKVSQLTREHLREVITAFIVTGAREQTLLGEKKHTAPYYRQGSGTINVLLLAMLSLIADHKQNVVFAMEEPETSIPPYAQKQIAHEVRELASQVIFTSHSPYVLEQFDIDETVVLSDTDGVVERKPIKLPDNLRLRQYRQGFRTRFCEGLLARRVLIAEGATEAVALPVVCRHLANLDPEFRSLESLGICTIDACGERNIAGLAKLYRKLGKRVFAFCDKQKDDDRDLICVQVDPMLMHEEKRFEDLILKEASEEVLKRYAGASNFKWPSSDACDIEETRKELINHLAGLTGKQEIIADCLVRSTKSEIPTWLQNACLKLKRACGLASTEGSATDSPDYVEFGPRAL